MGEWIEERTGRGGAKKKTNHYSLSDRRKLQWSALILQCCPVAWPLPLCPRRAGGALSNLNRWIRANVAGAWHHPGCVPVAAVCIVTTKQSQVRETAVVLGTTPKFLSPEHLKQGSTNARGTQGLMLGLRYERTQAKRPPFRIFQFWLANWLFNNCSLGWVWEYKKGGV